MPRVDGKSTYVNPFFQQVDDDVRTELNVRGNFYGRRVRGVGAELPKNVVWSYQKTAFGRVVSKSKRGVSLGLPGSNVMSDKDGNLTLYNAARNVPNKPLLTSIEVSNEGTMGSLLKGKFSFIAFPSLGSNGFSLGDLDEAFFTPGNEVEISFGWSVHAAKPSACSLKFTGIIYSFNWTFNNDMSITADVSIVSAASIALGTSGDQTMPNDDGAPKLIDPLDKNISSVNLATKIDNDLLLFKNKRAPQNGYGVIKEDDPIYGSSKALFTYYAISLPIQESSTEEGSKSPPPVTKTRWYVTLGSLTEYMNKIIEAFEGDNPTLGRLFKIRTIGNETAYNKDVKSAYPTDVFFPDSEMGKYGEIQPFKIGFLKSDVQDGTINIGNILLGTDYIKETYNKFLDENSVDITYRNITSFINALIGRINRSTGDIYQLTTQLIENPNVKKPDGRPSEITPKKPNDKDETLFTILSVEDSNIPKQHTDQIAKNAFLFDGRIFKPLIKSVQISSSPPKEMASAAYTAARSGDGKKVKPANLDNSVATKEQKDLEEFETEEDLANKAIKNGLDSAKSSGFNDSWSESFRGGLVGLKKFRTGGDAHWLNQSLYPINFSVTIDGINGFKFGDTIKTNLVPSKYSKPPVQLLFTVTKINHLVKDGVWETTLNTAARINMGD